MYKMNKPSIDRVHLKHFGHIPANLDYPSKSVAELMFENCEKHYNYQALKYSQNGLIYRENYIEFANNIELTAKMLKLNGVEKGDKVMVLSPFLPEEYHVKYAVSAVGAVLVPLHPNESKSSSKMTSLLDIVKPKLIICLDSCVPDLDYLLYGNKVIDQYVERILYYSPVDSLKGKGLKSIINPIIDLKYKKSGIGPESLKTKSTKFASFHKERNSAKNYHGSYMTNVKGEDDYVIYFSSGTSGKMPSGAIHTNNSCNSLSITGNYICDCVKPGQKLIIVPGPFHCFGSETGRNTLVNAGVEQIIIPNPKDLDAIASAQKEEQAEIHIYVPLIMSKMKDSGKFDDVSYENTELFISGGGKLSPLVSKYWNDKLPNGRGVREGYGSSQTNGGICINLKDKQIPGTIGIPLSDFYFKLVDLETGAVINEPNKPGELYIAGPSLMRAIIEEEDSNSLTVDEENVTWYKTNDMVQYNEDGWYTFIDRVDDVLNLNSGNLVNPNEIRTILEKYNLDNSIIFNTNGREDDPTLDRIILCIEYNGEAEDIEMIKRLLEAEFITNLKKYEIPSEIIVFSQLPINLNGKFLKNQTKEMYFNNEYTKKLVLSK